jgi:holo-[acyl-carrier protein] synthase
VPTAPAGEERALELRVGVDMIGVERLERVVGVEESRARAVFTERELQYCRGRRHPFEHLAARFAAKEAVLKAFGTGMTRRLRWTEIEVLNERSGRPRVVLDGSVAEFARRHGLRDLDVSLTHAEGLAVAQAVTVWERRRR